MSSLTFFVHENIYFYKVFLLLFQAKTKFRVSCIWHTSYPAIDQPSPAQSGTQSCQGLLARDVTMPVLAGAGNDHKCQKSVQKGQLGKRNWEAMLKEAKGAGC